jgi:hypothetical protein
LQPPFTHSGLTHRVFWIGNRPPVLVMHELPGLSPAARPVRRELPGGSIFNPPHANADDRLRQAPNDPAEPTRQWFEESRVLESAVVTGVVMSASTAWGCYTEGTVAHATPNIGL